MTEVSAGRYYPARFDLRVTEPGHPLCGGSAEVSVNWDGSVTVTDWDYLRRFRDSIGPLHQFYAILHVICEGRGHLPEVDVAERERLAAVGGAHYRFAQCEPAGRA